MMNDTAHDCIDIRLYINVERMIARGFFQRIELGTKQFKRHEVIAPRL